MRKLYISLMMLSVSVLLSSCHGDLNVEQPSYFTTASMWTSESDAESAVNGMYSLFRVAFNENLAVYGDLRGALYGPGMISSKDYDRLAANDLSRDITGSNWAAIYTVINECNLILKYAPQIEFSSESKRNEVMANAYFVRGWCYFQIARIWGDAPVVTSGYESETQEDMYPSRNPQAEVFAQVENDANEAVRLMPASVSGIHKANAASVNMLKADYYLWKAKRLGGGDAALNEARTAVNEVLGNSKFGFEDNFADIFGVENEKSKEIIFSMDFTRNEYTGGYPSMFLGVEQYLEDKSLANNPIPIGSHNQYLSITDEYEAFLTSEYDTRSEVSFGVYQEPSIRWRWIAKYEGEWTSETRYFSSDLIVYRYAEAILMQAEIENALNNPAGATAALGRIAQRAYGDQSKYASLSDKAEIDKVIVDEILREFVAEAKSWWTFVRFGVAFDRVPSLNGREGETNILLWPVATACINTNPNIKQTDGFN